MNKFFILSIILYFPIYSLWVVNDKDKFSGAYFGLIENNPIGIIISLENDVVIGTIFLENSERLSFLGVLNSENIIEPNLFLPSIKLELELSLYDKQIELKIADLKDERSFVLKKVSKNLAYTFTKELKNNTYLDDRLFGTWKMIASLKNDIEYPSKEAKGNYKNVYRRDGRYISDQRTKTEIKKLGINTPDIPFRWYCNGNILIIEVAQGHPLSGTSRETFYEIKNDTLIQKIDEFKFIFIKD